MKKKIFIIALAACLFALSIAGSSIAYFTDVEEATNVFTTGDVNITLTYKENVVENDDDDDTNNAFELSSLVYPGQTYEMDAIIAPILWMRKLRHRKD